MSPQRKWFTCTPVRFKGDQGFFARDSGLLCKGFQEIGVECKAVMPGPPMEDDQIEDLIRTEYRNLEDPEWWKSMGGEGVVFYGWGAGRYVKIARAIHQAGLVLVTHMDSSGLLGVLNGFSVHAGTLWRVGRGVHGKGAMGLMQFMVRLGYASTLGLIRNDWRRARHLKQAHWIGSVTPIAVDRIRHVCRIQGGPSLADRVQLIPHPVASYMVEDPQQAKERLCVAVGRWYDAQKDTHLLLATIHQVLAADTGVSMEIYGAPTPLMESWHLNLADGMRRRVYLQGVVPNAELRRALTRSRVLLCSSLYESFHIAAAEALCCGCSVVGPDVPEIPSMNWFTDGPFGRMAERTADGLARAVLAELADWDGNRRDAGEISAHWCQLLHAPRVAARILELVDTGSR